ncbi:MAG: peptidoglycan DD-metalloendopeptidase family protein [Steroidobacteraceae bacterium]
MSAHRIFILSAALLLTACSSQPIRGNYYLVKSGDTVYSIAARAGMDYRELAKLNNIGRDYRIYAGQTLRLASSSSLLVNKSAASKPAAKSRAVIAPPSNIKWQWPSNAQSYVATTQPNGGVGLSITGQLGQDVFAAASGSVLYAGRGLLGYGQLIIIKHDEIFLSAYAHLNSMLVQEGAPVTVGQKIATMGNDTSGKPLLYFEIRVNGVPVEPLPMLLKQ